MAQTILQNHIYEDIAIRSGGEIFVGVVGPVRTGKSTLIKKFMTELILPNVTQPNSRTIITDEMPQSAGGKTIMTTEPKFIPGKAVKVQIEKAVAQVRFCDCVGFVVDGVQGVEEDGNPRLIKTPWRDESMPFAQAAEWGTQKVIADHSTIALCVTSDGSFGDIPRSSFVLAEEKTVQAVKKTGKPYVLLVNCQNPRSLQTQQLCEELSQKYDCGVRAINAEQIDQDGLLTILKDVLFAFPMISFDVDIPLWMQALPVNSSAVSELLTRVQKVAQSVVTMDDSSRFDGMLADCKYWQSDVEVSLDLSTGKALVTAKANEDCFFELLSEEAGVTITDNYSLMQYVAGTAQAKRSYDKIKDAFECAKMNGYGVVSPDEEEMQLDSPKMVKRNGAVGIKLRACAPCYHIVKVDVHGEVSPIMGNGVQNGQLVSDVMDGFEKDADGMWTTNLFGRSLKDMVKEGLAGKVSRMSDETKVKMRRAITKIVNDGRGNVICIVL